MSTMQSVQKMKIRRPDGTEIHLEGNDLGSHQVYRSAIEAIKSMPGAAKDYSFNMTGNANPAPAPTIGGPEALRPYIAGSPQVAPQPQPQGPPVTLRQALERVTSDYQRQQLADKANIQKDVITHQTNEQLRLRSETGKLPPTAIEALRETNRLTIEGQKSEAAKAKLTQDRQQWESDQAMKDQHFKAKMEQDDTYHAQLIGIAQQTRDAVKQGGLDKATGTKITVSLRQLSDLNAEARNLQYSLVRTDPTKATGPERIQAYQERLGQIPGEKAELEKQLGTYGIALGQPAQQPAASTFQTAPNSTAQLSPLQSNGAASAQPTVSFQPAQVGLPPAPRDPQQRQTGTVYAAPDGRKVKWTGNGWEHIQSAPPVVTSDADYDTLPPGTVFIAPDGTTRRKSSPAAQAAPVVASDADFEALPSGAMFVDSAGKKWKKP